MAMKISPEDHARIGAAVAAAEKGTSGEIRCVLAPDSADMRLFNLSLGAGAALIAPAAGVLLGLRPQALAERFSGWSVGHLGTADEQALTALTVYIGLQAIIFGLVWLLASWPALARVLTPKSVLKRRVHEAALAQFEILGLTHTRDRTGILLYVSLAEHRAEVLADEGIYAKAPKEVWNEIVGLLVAGLKAGDPGSGFVRAVERTGGILAACLPPRDDDANELPDGLTEMRR